jgi:hypothetical protein
MIGCHSTLGACLNRLGRLSAILLPAFVILLGYLPFFINALYMNTFSGDLEVVNLMHAPTFCPDGRGYCENRYEFHLPLSTIAGRSLLVGNIFNSSIWKCSGKTFFTTGNARDFTNSRGTHNEYFIVDSRVFDQCSASEFEISVSFPKSQVKSGIMNKELILAPSDIAAKIKSAYEFVYKDYKILNLCSILFVLLFSLFIQIVSFDPKASTRFQMSLLLLVGAYAQSGLLEVFIPFAPVIHFDRWMATLAYCGYVALSVRYLSSGSRAALRQRLMLSLFPILLLITQDRITTWIYYSFVASGILLVLSAWERNQKLFILGVLALLTSLDFIKIPGMPNSYIVPTYLALLIFRENQKAFLYFLRINRILRLSTKNGSRVNGGKFRPHRTHALVKLFQRQFNVQRITILNVTDPNIIQIQQYSSSRSGPTSMTFPDLPPIFAHVLTTGNSLINVHADSELIGSLRRGEAKSNAASEYFTVLPLFSGRETVGAISLTDYDIDQFKSALNYSTFLFCLDVLNGILVEQLLTTPKTESLSKMAKLNAQMEAHDFGGCIDVEDVIRESGTLLNQTFGWRVLSASLPYAENLLKVLKCHSFDEDVERQITGGKLYAHEDNRQGPLALAVHGKKPVLIPNTRWLDGVVHKNTTKFFTIHNTRTAAFVPVMGGNEGRAIGVYWIEGVQGNEISYSDRELFNSFSKALSERIKLMKSDSRLKLSQQSLAQFLPEHLVERYMAGHDVSESDYGFLMMFD